MLPAWCSRGAAESLRDYTGILPNELSRARPWTAVGTEIVIRVDAVNSLAQARDRDLRRVHTVPDPYYVEGVMPEGEGVRFVNLPNRAVIRIYSASGVLLRILEHNSELLAGDTFWDLRTRSGQRVASGVYFYHVEAGDARRAGRMTIINFTN